MDLNGDLGEGFDDDEALFGLVSSANVACGGHAGDEGSMRGSVLLALSNGVALGAHPSYDDRQGFGRVATDVPLVQLTALVRRQVAALRAVAERAGASVAYVKPHGALYNRIAVDAEQAAAVVDALDGLPILGPTGSVVERVALAGGVRFVREAFVDRGYAADGTLAPRGTPGALLADPDEIAARAVQLATTGGIRAIDGTPLQLAADSLCLHGDHPGAVRNARAVRFALENAGVEIGPFAGAGVA